MNPRSEIEEDRPLSEVWTWLQGHQERSKDGVDLETVFAGAVRKALDEVIDGARTGRFRYDELERQEKSYVGTRIEIVVRTALGLLAEGKLDTVVAGHPVDFKWSASGNWMIPREAVGELCLVLSGNEARQTFSVGLVRCRGEWLNKGKNQDSKRTLSKAGRAQISWLVHEGNLEENFLASLDPNVLAAVLAQPTGQGKIRELFSRLPGKPVPRDVIHTLAVQEDPMRRIRQDKDDRLGGLKVLGGHYSTSRRAAEQLGYGPLRKGDYISLPVRELRDLPQDLQRDLKLREE